MTIPNRRMLIVLPFVLMALAFAACGTASPAPSSSPSPTAGIRGSVLVWGLLGQTSPQPQPGQAVVAREGDWHGRVVARTTTDSSGAFVLGLSPGTYAVGLAGTQSLFKTVIVKPGTYVAVTLKILAK